MPSVIAPESMPKDANSTLRKISVEAFGGACAAALATLPRSGQLGLTSRESAHDRLTAALHAEWLKLIELAKQDLLELVSSGEQFAAMFEYDSTQLSRVLAGKANPPGWFLAFILWRCKTRKFIQGAAGLAEGTYEPNPPMSVAEENAKIVAAICANGMEGVARLWAGLPSRELVASLPGEGQP